MTDFSARIKTIRVNLLGLNRSEFAVKFGVPEITIRSWESNKTLPTEKSIDKLVSALENANIKVEKKWLSEGIGRPPTGIKSSIELESLEEDLFLRNNPDAIFFKLKTNDYGPMFLKGCELCVIPINDNTENLSFVVLNPTDTTPTIMRLLLAKSGERILVPLSYENGTKALIVTIDMLLYRIISWKHNPND